jgi:hypothetical protein
MDSKRAPALKVAPGRNRDTFWGYSIEDYLPYYAVINWAVELIDMIYISKWAVWGEGNFRY